MCNALLPMQSVHAPQLGGPPDLQALPSSMRTCHARGALEATGCSGQLAIGSLGLRRSCRKLDKRFYNSSAVSTGSGLYRCCCYSSIKP